jgi:predicted MFS family arabinose efflux permease
MPFMVMGALGLCGAMLLRGLLPASTHSYMPKKTRLMSASRSLFQRPAVRAMLCYAFLVSCASDIFFVTYALWLADGFSMGVMALGVATVAIGVAELGGELLTATLADRLGLGRTMLITLLVTAACYALLPLLGTTATGAVVGIFLLCLAAEFNLVAAMSLSTEIQPNARATMMSWFQATSGMGHVVGVVAGGLIWMAGGITGVGLICAVLCLVSFFAVRWGLRQWQGVSADECNADVAIRQWPEPSGQTSSQATVLLPIW